MPHFNYQVPVNTNNSILMTFREEKARQEDGDMEVMAGITTTMATQMATVALVRECCPRQGRFPPISGKILKKSKFIQVSAKVSLAFHPDVPINSGVVTHMVRIASHICCVAHNHQFGVMMFNWRMEKFELLLHAWIIYCGISNSSQL